MEEIMNLFNQYARSELMILVPVLYFITMLIHKSDIPDLKISLIVTAISVILSILYSVAVVNIFSLSTLLLAVFSGFTQGVLFAGASMFAGLIINPNIGIINKK